MRLQFKWPKTFFEKKLEIQNVSGEEYDTSQLGTELDDFMLKQRPFLLNRYTLRRLSDDSGIPLSDLFFYIICDKGMTFKDFINSYRIGYCLQLLGKAHVQNVSIFDLTIICGFVDQGEFTRAFKKAAKVPISEYIKNSLGERLPICDTMPGDEIQD